MYQRPIKYEESNPRRFVLSLIFLASLKNRETSRRNTRGTTGARDKEDVARETWTDLFVFLFHFWRPTRGLQNLLVFLKISSRRSGAEYDRCAWNARVDGVVSEK